MIWIGFGTNEKWTSKLIRWATGGQYSHAWIEYQCPVMGAWMVLHSWGTAGVVIMPRERVDALYPVQTGYECKADLTKGIEWARPMIGTTKYDFGVIWNGLVLFLYRATKWEWLNNIVHRNASKYSCSELIAGILKHAGTVAGAESLDIELTPPDGNRGLLKFCDESDDCWVT